MHMETMKGPFSCFCGKQFSSGKAMGGHKKVHSQNLRRSHDGDDPGKKKTCRSLSPNQNNLKGGGGAAVICARTEIASAANAKPGVPPKKRKVIMDENSDESKTDKPYFCSICGVCFQSHRSLSAHSGHHTKAARKNLSAIKVYESSSSSDDHNDEDYEANDEEEDEAESEAAEKRVAYNCPYNCNRVFRSGKALGGHKRHCRNRAAAAGLAGGCADHGREAAANEERNGGGNNNNNGLGFDLNEVPDLDN